MPRLTDKTELAETPATGDFFHVVDVSDTTGSPEGTSKKVTFFNLSSTVALSRVLYVDTNAATGGDGSIGFPFNTIAAAQTAITDATLDNPYTLLIAGDDTNVPATFKDFVYFKGAGTKQTTILKGIISDNNALTVLFNNLTIEDNWDIGDGTAVATVVFINTIFESLLGIISDGTGASITNFALNDFKAAVAVRTKTFISEGNIYESGLILSSVGVTASESMIVTMHNDNILGQLGLVTVATRPMVANFTGCRFDSPVLFTLVAGANLTLTLDETTYNSMVEAGTDFNIPNLVVNLPFQVTIPEEFGADSAIFIGELGLPAVQGWTDTAGGSSTITISNEDVFGKLLDVVKYTVIGGGEASSELAVSAADWTNVLTFGTSFSSLSCRMEEETGNGIFAGMGFSLANDPRSGGGVQSRVGFFVKEDGTFTTVQLDGSSLVTLNGAGGVPTVLQNEFFIWECKINPTPDAGVNFGTVELFVNGVLITTGGIVSSNNAVNDVVSVNRSSSSGTTTFYLCEFGSTIYTESNTKTLEAVTMQANTVQVVVPAGKRDYTIELPNGNPQAVGAILEIIPSNLLGSITLTNESSPPDALFNFENNLVLEITTTEVLIGINRQANGNNYFGFGVDLSEGGAYTMSGVDIVTAVGFVDTPVKITTDENDTGYSLAGFEHSDNRLTKVFPGVKKFLVVANVSGNNADAGNNDGRMHLFVNGSQLTPAAVTGAMTLEAASDDSAGVSAIIEMDIGDFVEAFIENNSNGEDFGCTDLNVTLIEFG